MAIIFRTSAAGGGTTGTSNRTVTITPAVNDLFVVFADVDTNTNDLPTCTDDNGGTYDLLRSVPFSSSANRLACWIRRQALPNTTSTVITANTGSNVSGNVVVVACSGATVYGALAVRQFAYQQNQAASGTPAPAFAFAALTGNMTIGAVGNSTNPATMTVPSGWTERQDVGQTNNAIGLEVVTRDSGFTGTTVTWGGTSASVFASMILELTDASLNDYRITKHSAMVDNYPATRLATVRQAGLTFPTNIRNTTLAPVAPIAQHTVTAIGLRHTIAAWQAFLAHWPHPRNYGIPIPPAADTTTILRQPQYIQHWRPTPAPHFEGPNLLMSTLGGPPPDTTTILRQPLIIAHVWPPARPSVIPPNLLTSTLAPVQASPFAQADWPVPNRPNVPLPPRIATRGFEPEVDAPFVPAAWPVPARPHPTTHSRFPNLQQSTLAPIVAGNPFVQSLWPVPARPRPNVTSLTARLSFGAVVPPAGDPFNQLSWPVPPRPGRQRQSLSVRELQEYPFSEANWPVPDRPRRVQPFTPQNALILGITPPVTGAPFRSVGWPVPPRPRPPQHSVPQSPLILGITPPAFGTPFAQTVWPVPARPPRFLQPRTSRLSFGAIVPPAGDPFTQTSWPVPPRPARQRHGMSQRDLLPYPFAETQWPVPARRRVEPHTHALNLLTTTLASAPVQAPFAQRDWPVPARAQRLQVGTVQSLNTTVLAPAAVPFAQRDWPLPARRLDRTGRTETFTNLLTHNPIVSRRTLHQFGHSTGARRTHTR